MISIIVAVYNTEKYLDECLESIAGQTYSDTEIILVDDGSTDSSGAICDKWAEKDGRIRVIHSENRGAGAARNQGLDIAIGDYFLFCDSDDYYENNAVQLLYDALVDNQADIAVANIQRVDLSRKLLEIDNGKSFERAGLYTTEEAWDYVAKECWGTILLVCKLYKRSVWDCVRFPEIRAYEDEAVFHLLMERTHKIAFIEEALYNYRQSEGSIMRSPGVLKRLILPEVLIPRIEYLFSNNLYRCAEFNFYKGIWSIAEVYSRQNLYDSEIKEKIEKIRKQYKKLSKLVFKHSKNLKQLNKLMLSQISLPLYKFVCLRNI